VRGGPGGVLRGGLGEQGDGGFGLAGALLKGGFVEGHGVEGLDLQGAVEERFGVGGGGTFEEECAEVEVGVEVVGVGAEGVAEGGLSGEGVAGALAGDADERIDSGECGIETTGCFEVAAGGFEVAIIEVG